MVQARISDGSAWFAFVSAYLAKTATASGADMRRTRNLFHFKLSGSAAELSRIKWAVKQSRSHTASMTVLSRFNEMIWLGMMATSS